MTDKMIARWNEISLNRPPDEPTPTLKRERPEDGDEDDGDDVSLVSRSPSPSHAAMVVDEGHVHEYDRYAQGIAPEVITVETKIKPTNKGFAMLAKLGWVEGQPVGLSGDGRVDPIPFHVKTDSTGLGKISQDVRMIETTVSQRRGLDSERQQKESEEQRKLREDVVARKMALESEISSTLRAFYCALCDKQFKNVAQYDEHTNSYAHHHKARLKDMQANVRIKPQEEVDKRKEKERKREERELRKIAAANGIRMPKLPAALTPVLAPDADTGVMGMDVDSKPADPPSSGWASISGPAGSSSGGGFKKSGWATVASSTSAASPPLIHSTNTSSQVPSSSYHSPPTNAVHVPTFRNAGWTSLDTGSTQPPLPPPSQPPQPPPREAPPPALPSTKAGWSRGGFGPTADSSTRASGPAWQSSPAPPLLPPPEQAAQSQLPVPPPSHPPPSAATEAQPVRSNWQQFQKGVRRR